MLYLSDFEFHKSTGVWVPPGSGSGTVAFAYSDGVDEEARLLSAVTTATDLSENADALMPFVEDWPSYYHLAPGRSNAIRSLGLPRDINVLELGAGCGALSRHLGENHTSVHSVEGSAARAAICRARCKDLPNVSVFQADFSSVAFAPEYDMVLLNGVLEYAPSLFPREAGIDPVGALLGLAKSALRRGGIILIGIENKVGLKYWCGAPEDHTATTYEGIHGYPGTTKVATFSKREIAQVIRSAGFPAMGFFYCFPDYKFASTVLSDELPPHMYLHNWLDYPAECPGLARAYSIHEGLAGKSLYEAGLLGEFANSFLIVAGADGAMERFPSQFRPGWIARRLSVRGRDKSHHRVTALARTDGQLVVTKESVPYGHAPNPPTPMVTAWIPGELLVLEMSRAMLSVNPDEAVHVLLDEYRQELLARFSVHENDSGGYPLLAGRCLDFLMRNIIRGPRGLEAIDLEWEAPEPIPLDFMLFRSMWNDVILPNQEWARQRIADFDLYTVKAIESFYPAYGFGRHTKNKAREQSFQVSVGTDPGRGSRAALMAGKAWGRVLTKRLRDMVGFS